MKPVVIIRYGEIGLKGKNRPVFVRQLLRNIERSAKVSRKLLQHIRGRIYLIPSGSDEIEPLLSKLRRIFGIESISTGVITEKTYQALEEAALGLVRGKLLAAPTTFKIEAARIDKKFPLTSEEIKDQLGERLRGEFQELTVNVHSPDFVLEIEIRDEGIVLSSNRVAAYGGLPVGISGRALALISGGIDSPVAAWYMMKRGLSVDFIYFESPPYTGEYAREKVLREAEILSSWNSRPIQVLAVPITKILEMIREKVPERLWTLFSRRAMHLIAKEYAARQHYNALITGDSLGQVASQTIQNLKVVERGINMPLFRPLIGLNKQEIISRAKEIGTFKISTLPYDDCCAIFSPKRPETQALEDDMLQAEREIFSDAIFEGAQKESRQFTVNFVSDNN